jgi:serine/threonine protein kinase/outer membrane protein assembly factor BamB
LKASVYEKIATRVAQSKTPVAPNQIARSLVKRDLLTAWQARQLLAGRNAFFLGRYKLMERIGKGGMGVVFKAEHAVMERNVAIKVMSRELMRKPRAVARFHREVKAAAALNHPNIIIAHDAASAGNTHFLVMEYVQGVDLNRWLRAIGPMPVGVACDFAMQVAEGLVHAHRQGMVHRDIKPYNMLVTWDEENERPVVKLLDMGLARFISETQDEDGLTRTGQMIGTPDYIAPEAAQSFKDADIRADIFSLGCSLFKLLTGRVPFPGENAMEKVLARVKNDAPLVTSLRKDVPPEVAEVVAKMLARDPNKRYQEPSEVVKALRPLTATELGQTESLEQFRTPPRVTIDDDRVEADADTSLEEFFRDFSMNPASDSSPVGTGQQTPPGGLTHETSPQQSAIPTADEEIGFAPLDSDEERAAAVRSGSKPSDKSSTGPPPREENRGENVVPAMDLVDDEDDDEGVSLVDADEDGLVEADASELIEVSGDYNAPDLGTGYSADLGADLDSSLGAGLGTDLGAHGGLTVADPFASDPLTSDDAGEPSGKKKRRKLGGGKIGGPKRIQGSWDSPLMLIGGAALLLLLIGGAGFLWRFVGISAEQRFRVAEEAYSGGRYREAIRLFDEYLEAHPGHTSAEVAQIHRGLASLRQAVESGGNWSKVLELAKQTINDMSSLQFRERAGPEFAALLPTLARGLAEQARDQQDMKLVDEADETLKLIKAYVPSKLIPTAEMTQIDQILAQTRHELAQSDSLAKAITTIRTKIDEQQPLEGYPIARQLIKDYPNLEDNAELKEAVLAISGAVQATVTVAEPGTAPRTTPAAGPMQATWVFSSRGGENLAALKDQVALARAGPTLFGLEASTGRVLWRRFIGFDGRAEELPSSGPSAGSALLFDAVSHEAVLINQQSGDLRWRIGLNDALADRFTFSGNEVLAPTESGRLFRIDAESGQVKFAWQLPQRLVVGASVARGPGVVYQLAENVNLYLLSLKDNSCLDVVYLGHEPGSITVAPAVIGRYLIMAENHRLEESRLRVFLTDEAGGAPQEVQQIDLDGHVHYPLAADNRKLCVVTDRGAMYSFDIAPPGESEPLTKTAEMPAEKGEPLIREYVVNGDQIWVSGRGLSEYEIQSARGRFQLRWAADRSDLPLQPPQVLDEVVIHVHRNPASNDVVASAVERKSGKNPWQTQLAAPMAGVKSGASNQLLAIDGWGQRFTLEPNPQTAQSLETARRVPTLEASLDNAEILMLNDQLAAVVGSGAKTARIYDLSDSDAAPRVIQLPDIVATRPVAFQGGMLAAGQGGQLFHVAPDGDSRAIEPFAPRMTPGQEAVFFGPTLINEREVLLASDQGLLYRISLAEGVTPHLEAAAQITLPGEPLTAPAVIGEAACLVTSDGHLRWYRLPQLEEVAEPLALEGRPVWGPRRVGNRILVATDRQQLYCLDEQQALVFQTALEHGPLAGTPIEVDDQFLVVSTTGVVIRLSAEGKPRGEPIITQQPMLGDPLLVVDRLVLPGADGTVHWVPLP